jgi:hypothetical protein
MKTVIIRNTALSPAALIMMLIMMLMLILFADMVT